MGKITSAIQAVTNSLEAVAPNLDYLDNVGAQREKINAELKAAEAKLAAVLAATTRAEAGAEAAKERLAGLQAEVDAKYKQLLASKADELKRVQQQIDKKLTIVRSLEQQLRAES